MKTRTVLAVCLLIVLLLMGFLSSFGIYRTHMPLSKKMADAGQLALNQDLEGCRSLTREAFSKWQKIRDMSLFFLDHQGLEHIDSRFQILHLRLDSGNAHQAAASCAELSSLFEAEATSLLPVWWNLF